MVLEVYVCVQSVFHRVASGMLLDDCVVLGVLLAHTYSQDRKTTAVLDTTLTLQALPRRGDHPRVGCSWCSVHSASSHAIDCALRSCVTLLSTSHKVPFEPLYLE